MYGSVFFVYGVGLWYGSKLVRDAHADDPECKLDPSLTKCFSGGKTMIVREHSPQGITILTSKHTRALTPQ